MSDEKIIGIVGGVGPYAGLDLAAKIFAETEAQTDQDHLPVSLLSLPGEIEDRTAFLLGEVAVNPAHAIVRIIRRLEALGARAIGIPCNTAHSPRIYDVIVDGLAVVRSAVTLVHMINEVRAFLSENYPSLSTAGVLCTTGTYETGVYRDLLGRDGSPVIWPTESLRADVHAAIYDPVTGIKAQSAPVTEKARRILLDAIGFLQSEGAEVIVLGCSEIPLAITEKKIGETVLIDPTRILARALIREASPRKLRPLARG